MSKQRRKTYLSALQPAALANLLPKIEAPRMMPDKSPDLLIILWEASRQINEDQIQSLASESSSEIQEDDNTSGPWTYIPS